MKITFLIHENTKQLVLTPELDSDRAIFKLFGSPEKVKVYKGGFFDECQGGWMRQYPNEDSLILVIE